MKKWLFEFLFEDMPIIKWLNGHKTELSRAVMFLSAVIKALQLWFPEYSPVSPEVFDAQVAMLLSLIGIQVGQMHKEVKGE